jgi:hypothetical protein
MLMPSFLMTALEKEVSLCSEARWRHVRCSPYSKCANFRTRIVDQPVGRIGGSDGTLFA